MSLLSVTVKKAHFVGPQSAQFNTYVTLKLQNVKSTTVVVKGADPCWEQDFLFETNDVTAGLLVEVWNKGMLWDKAIGYHWLPLPSVHVSNEEGCGRWFPLAGELVVRGSEIVGTAGATGHAILLDCRFELPFGSHPRVGGVWRSDSLTSTLRWAGMPQSPYGAFRPVKSYKPFESYRISREPYKLSYPPYRTGPALTSAYDAEGTEAAELQRKLDLLNCLAGQERADQARRQRQYTAHSGYSEDSDYTSDLNYPVGQHPNSSASQFKAAAHQLNTPQRSLETSRENSYERDEVMYGHGQGGGGGMRGVHDDGYGGGGAGGPRWDPDPEPLYYNSRPRYTQEHSRMEGWRQNQLLGQHSMESEASFHSALEPPSRRTRLSPSRKPSLERQNTSYDDTCDLTPTYTAREPQFPKQASYEEFYDTSSYPYLGEESFTVNEEDRTWDSGGYYFGQDYTAADRSSVTTTVDYENTVNKRRSSVIQLPQIPPKARPQSVISEAYGGTPRRNLRRTASRAQGRITPELTSRGASLPATPPGTPRAPRQLPRPPAPASLPPVTTTPRMLPRPPTATSQLNDGISKFYPKPYNEDYNYGYDSLEDQSQSNIIDSTDTSDYIWPRKRLPSVTESSRKLPAPPLSRTSNSNIYQTDLQQDQKSIIQTPQAYSQISLFNTQNFNNVDQNDYITNGISYNLINQNKFTTDTIMPSSFMSDPPVSILNKKPMIQKQISYNEDKPYGITDKPYIENQQPYMDDQTSFNMNDSFYSADSQPYVEETEQYFEDQKPYTETQEFIQDQSTYQTDQTYSFNKQPFQEPDQTVYGQEPMPYYDESSQPYYEDRTPYTKDLSPYQTDITNSYQQDAQQYHTPVTTSMQNTSYISEDSRIPYGSSQWKPSEPINQVPVTMAATSIYTPEVTKSLPKSQSSATQLQAGIAGAPVAAAAAAQTFGRFMASGAMKLGSLLSAAAPKMPPVTTAATTITPTPRPQLRQQISVTEPESAYSYPPTSYPSTTYPQATYAESTYPQTTYAESTYPQTTYPESTYPQTTYSESTYPETSYPQTTYADSSYPQTTYPDSTYPETTYPQTTYPQSTYPESTYPATSSVTTPSYKDPHASGDPTYSYGVQGRDLSKQDSLDYSVQDDNLSDSEYSRKQSQDRGYLQNQDSMEDYAIDEHGMHTDYSSKARANQDSPVSVIHVDRLEPISGSFEDENDRDRRIENSLVEPYRPKPMSPAAGSRKASVEAQYRGSPALDGLQLSALSGLTPGMKDLLPEPLGSPPPDTRLPLSHAGEPETGSLVGSGSEGKAKSVSFEEEETTRKPAGPRQRWHWAYAKILMQLNAEILNL